MSKFGDLIDANLPVLLDFYATRHTETNVQNILVEVAAALGSKAKVIKIDVDKNKELADALRVKSLPTFMLYKDGEMLWRQSGFLDAATIIGVVQRYGLA